LGSGGKSTGSSFVGPSKPDEESEGAAKPPPKMSQPMGGVTIFMLNRTIAAAVTTIKMTSGTPKRMTTGLIFMASLLPSAMQHFHFLN